MQRIRTLWNEGRVVIVPHAGRRLKERGLDVLDLEHIIRFGRVTEHSRPATRWRYRVDGRAVDGTPGTCVVEVDGTLIVVTVFV